MRRIASLLLIVAASALAALGGGVAASAQTPIAPDQHFLGLVNGSNDDPIVYTVCGGPISPGRTGSVLGGQTLAVAQVAQGGGFTGPFSQVFAWFLPTTSATPAAAPVTLKFAEYGLPQAIPTSVRVPCDGTGQVDFSSCPYLAPCAYGWVPDLVTVRFVNVAL